MKKLILIVLLLFAASARADVMGTDGSAFTAVWDFENNMRADIAAPTVTGTLDSARILMTSNPATTFSVKVAVYLAGDTTIVDSCTAQNIGTKTKEWVTFQFVNHDTVIASTNYLLTAWSDASVDYVCRGYYNSSGGDGYRINSQTYGAWPSPTDGWTTDADGRASILVYYTPLPATGPPQAGHSAAGHGVGQSAGGATSGHKP